MSWLSAFSFASPFLLIALISLPAIWILLRVTPPSPTRIPFPPLVIIRQWMREESSPARIPLWILILRLCIAAALIFAMAGPVYAPEPSRATGRGPLALYIETGWPVADQWTLRQNILAAAIKDAEQAERPLLLVSSGDGPGPVDLLSPAAAMDRLRALTPLTYRPDRKAALEKLATSLRTHDTAELILSFDGLASADDDVSRSILNDAIGSRQVRTLQNNASRHVAIAGATNSADGLNVRIIRAASEGQADGRVIAFDAKGRKLSETFYQFAKGVSETAAVITLPTDLRNDITRVELAGIKSSGAVQLIDSSQKRHRIGLVSGLSTDIAQPLLTPDYYLARALEPHADLREPKQGVVDSTATLLDENPSIIILADVGALPQDVEFRLQSYVDQGGMLIRFAGPQLASAGGTLLPVRLRGNGRALQGALSWETPQKLSAFGRDSPFYGLAIPDDVTVTRQLLAEPDSDLSKKTWAALTDGTPLVTAERRGKGYLVLFHVTADTSWSSLPLSGLYLSLFERLLPLATREYRAKTNSDSEQSLQPYRNLDGFGQFVAPPPTARPVIPTADQRASADHPAGFYGEATAPYAINSLGLKSNLQSLATDFEKGDPIPLAEPTRIELTPVLLVLAALLMAFDGLAALIRGRGRALLALLRSSAIIGFALIMINAIIPDARAASQDIAPKDLEAAMTTRLAYVITGDNATDDISRIGLESLSRILNERTSFEPADPVGVDLKRDDLAVYPLLYWPVTANQALPTQDAVRRIDRFMKNGGTIIFDTRDASLVRDGDLTPETTRLRLILAGLSIPPLEPLPPDHVLTKAFYLIDRIVGRTVNGQTWLEALPKSQEIDGPARAGDGVSPIIITSNDLAAAWAMDQRGNPLLPIDPAMPRQREMALRGGVNIVMYVLTGNYKADQVHVPALLERLGQ